MKKIFLSTILWLSIQAAEAQFSLHAYAGPNLTGVDIRRTQIPNISYQTNLGWQVGAGFEYQTSPHIGLFFHLGTSYVHRSFFRDSVGGGDTTSTLSIRPNFVGLPLGVGYKFPLSEKLTLKAYGGLNIQIGLSGQQYRYIYFYENPNIDPNASEELQKKLVSVDNLRFGDRNRKDFTYDYASTDWQFMFGAGLMLNNEFEGMITLNKGFTNILPGRRATTEIQHFALYNLSLKYNFPYTIFDPKKK